jgi:acyl dehydratase
MLNETSPLHRNAWPAGHTLSREGPLLTQEAFNDFGELLGTDAPIHVDPAYARQTPFGNTIAQGMLLLAPLESWLCELFGESAWFEGGHLHVRLLKPAVAGERVTMHLRAIEPTAANTTALAFVLRCGERELATGKVSLRG